MTGCRRGRWPRASMPWRSPTALAMRSLRGGASSSSTRTLANLSGKVHPFNLDWPHDFCPCLENGRPGCVQHEWNDLLERNHKQCSQCHRQIRFHVSRSKSPASGKGKKQVCFDDCSTAQQSSGGNPKPILKHDTTAVQDNSGALEHLAKAIKVTTDPLIKSALQTECAKLASLRLQHAAAQDTAAEAVRKADSAWREADTKHTQAVNAVEKEKAAALLLASAAATKQDAARRLAQAE
ncbi:unnamed protein product [Prorocentrum cordatum]|uniref:Uncharacterized protein n=1 Tax=Prorocentrum cordatum TaxID=2364126 RepID=A0ABN9QA49_9DINO|nr:unnamed protein product [Polarella glacialis]